MRLSVVQGYQEPFGALWIIFPAGLQKIRSKKDRRINKTEVKNNIIIMKNI